MKPAEYNTKNQTKLNYITDFSQTESQLLIHFDQLIQIYTDHVLPIQLPTCHYHPLTTVFRSEIHTQSCKEKLYNTPVFLIN